MTARGISVLIVDDHPVVRAGLRFMLESRPGITVLADTGSGEEATSLARECDPDVVLCDLRLGSGWDGVEVTRHLRADHPDRPHVVILTTFDQDADIIRAVEAGASGYLLKDAAPGDIVEAIAAAHRGDTVLSSTMTARYVEALRARSVSLSTREQQVLALVAQGRTNRSIALELFVSEATVKTHVNHILTKLGAENRTAAVAAARAADML